MKKKKLFVGFILLGALGLSLFIFRHSVPLPRSSWAAASKVPTNSGTVAARAPDLNERISRAAGAECITLFEELATMADSTRRRALIARLLKQWIERDWKSLSAYVTALQKDAAKAYALMPLLGDGVVDCIPISKNREALFYPMVQTYAAVFGDYEAGVWSSRVLEKGQRSYPLVRIFGSITQADPAKAVELMMALPEGDGRHYALQYVATYWNFEDTKGAYAVAARFTGEDRAEFFRAYYGAWAVKDPEVAAAVLSQNQDPEILKNAAGRVGEMMGAQSGYDMSKALTWANSLANAEAKQNALNGIYKMWSERDPVGAVNDSFARYPDSPELAQTLFANGMNTRNDNLMLEYALEVDETVRPYAVKGVFQQIIRMDGIGSASTKVMALVDGRIRDSTVEYVALEAAKTNPALARQVAEKISDQKIRQRLLAKLGAG